MITTSPYEKAASVVITLLIMIGTMALLLFGIWFSSSLFEKRSPPVAVQIYGEGEGDGEGEGSGGGSGGGVHDDGPEYDPNVVHPGEKDASDEMTLLDALQIVGTLSANPSAFADSTSLDESILVPGGPKGDGRTKGGGGGRGKRHWEFVFPSGITAAEYARQLDFFGIELAVLQPGGKVAYVSNLSSKTPTVRYGASETENRYYLTWLKGDLQAVEWEILARAKVEHDGKLVLKFLPQPLEMQLAEMEAVKAGSQRDMLRATHFGIRPKSKTQTNEYEFFVTEQVVQ
ncbi:MAG: hypothetical protein FWC43_03515 [Planctomycetaceae bacterium]|nr:hypothetical protein [Planctomycetaceae bacterium]MCL2304391.1 hypothetical protein [Planctomycetaceae bacterium]